MPASLHINLLGPFRIERDGQRLTPPQSRKTRLLLAYLVSTGREHRRSKLCEMLWQDADDPRAGLRWALSRLRPLVNDDAVTRLVADAQTVSFDARDVVVDATALAGTDFTAAPTDTLVGLAERCGGRFLEDLELPEALDLHAYCLAERARLAERERALLDVLVARLADDPACALAFARRRAMLDPSDQSSQAALVTLLQRAGRTREAAEQLRATLEWLSTRQERPGPALRAVQQTLKDVPAPSSAPTAPAAPAVQRDDDAPIPAQDIRFCSGADGVQIAYARIGQGPPLLKTANFLNHLEFDWQSPIWRHWLRALSAESCLVRYDERGNGLSDRAPEQLDFEAFVDDVKTVADAAGLTRYPVLGISQGCAVAVEHALRNPERVSRLVLYGGFALGALLDHEERRRTEEALLALAEHGWGRANPAFRQVFSTLYFPEASAAQMRDFDELQRVTATPAQAVRLLRAITLIDVRKRLAEVRVPTLVLHPRHDALVPFEQGRLLAAGIPGARFVPLDSKNHLMLAHEPAFARCMAEIREFLREDGSS